MMERCAYCNLVIQWPEEHTVRDRDSGKLYHADCYAQYKTFTCNPMPPEWRIQTLGELFDKPALHRLRGILQKKDLQALDLFVNEHRDELIQKGVLPKYLYYYLSFAFRMEEKP